MNIQQAGDAARFNHQGGRQPTGVDEDLLGTLYVEPGVPEAIASSLKLIQHRLFDLGGELCIPGHSAINEDHVTYFNRNFTL